jgi:hypothetical protein
VCAVQLLGASQNSLWFWFFLFLSIFCILHFLKGLHSHLLNANPRPGNDHIPKANPGTRSDGFKSGPERKCERSHVHFVSSLADTLASVLLLHLDGETQSQDKVAILTIEWLQPAWDNIERCPRSSPRPHHVNRLRETHHAEVVDLS